MSESPLRVAHIDDDDDLRAVVRLALKVNAGIDVASLGSGQAALEVLPSFHPDIILVDLLMPGMGGVETLRALRERMDLSQVAVVLATGMDELDNSQDWSDAGVAAVIRKPFDADTLALRLEGMRPR